MNQQIASAVLTLISALMAAQQQGNDKSKRRISDESIGKKGMIDLHGTTHDGITVNSPTGQIRRGGKAIAGKLSNGRFVGVYDRQELIELEVFAAEGRKTIDAKQQTDGTIISQ